MGTRDGQALTETILRPPVPSLWSHRQILLVVWAPAKHPHPSSRDRNFPVASGYSVHAHTPELVTQLWCTRMAPTHPRRPDSPTEETAALHRGHRPLQGLLPSRAGSGGEGPWPGAKVLQPLLMGHCEAPINLVPSWSLFPHLQRKVSFHPGDLDTHLPFTPLTTL